MSLLKPLPHEVEAANFIHERSRVFIFDDNGVGKTVSVLEGLRLEAEGREGIKAMALMPTSLLGQWASEVDRFLGWNVVVCSGTPEERSIKFHYFQDVTGNVILITSYSLVQIDLFYHCADLDFLILDEAYLFRNMNTKIYRFLQSFVKQVPKCVILSGNVESLTGRQLANVCSLLAPGDYYGKTPEMILSELGDCVLMRKLEAILPYLTDTALIKKPVITTIPLQVSSLQKERLIEASRYSSYIKPATSGRSYRRAPRFPIQKQGLLLSTRTNYPDDDFSPMEEFLFDYLDSTENEKVVIFVSNSKFFNVLKGSVSSRYKAAVVYGGQSADIRSREINRFNLDQKIKCLLISGVGKFGLNLQSASKVVFMGVPKSKLDFMQVVTRLYRMGQSSQVEVIIPYMGDSQGDALPGFDVSWLKGIFEG